LLPLNHVRATTWRYRGGSFPWRTISITAPVTKEITPKPNTPKSKYNLVPVKPWNVDHMAITSAIAAATHATAMQWSTNLAFVGTASSGNESGVASKVHTGLAVYRSETIAPIKASAAKTSKPQRIVILTTAGPGIVD